uniref:MATH domain-containing protein n=1 Tax=Hordeum vulgare subsp. vulgare TaxID=112509 RepID=A0A8I6XUA4_HORVV
MGASASRPAPMTSVVRVRRYSKLVRSPELLLAHQLLFDDLYWDVRVRPMSFDEEGLAEDLVVSVSINYRYRMHTLDSAVGTYVSIEILDATGKHTVFHIESDRATIQEHTNYMLGLSVSRRELEASSCVCARYDEFTIRCTMEKKQQPEKKLPRLLRNLLKSNTVLELEPPPPQVAMAGSHTLTIDSISKLKAVLQDDEYAYSTHFAVGGSTWYFRFCPKSYKCTSCLYLVRANKAAEAPAATAEFSFQLEGVVNFESNKMRHTFDGDNRKFYFKLDSIADSPMHDDRLLVRCCLAVVMPEEIPTTVPTCRTESVITPLLSAMHG